MVAVLLSLALVFGAYDGTVESVDPAAPALIELEPEDAIVTIAPATPSSVVWRAVTEKTCKAPVPSAFATRIFRPPRG